MILDGDNGIERMTREVSPVLQIIRSEVLACRNNFGLCRANSVLQAVDKAIDISSDTVSVLSRCLLTMTLTRGS